MKLDKQIMDALGLNNTTITLGLDEDIQIAIEKKIDNYLKKIDEENERKKRAEFYKEAHENFKKKNEFANMLCDNFVYGKVKNKLVQDGFIYRCKYCWGQAVSGQYGKPLKAYKHNH